MQNQNKYTELIKSKAKYLGFSDCGITRPCYLNEDKPHINKWLNNNMFGEMSYMKNHLEKRLNPNLIMQDAKSIVSVIYNYNTGEFQKDKTAPKISKYSYSIDYHSVLKSKLKQLLIFIKNNIKNADGRYFVDTAPILERLHAKRAGLGWIGKNSCLITKEYGSFVFIGELFLNIELNYDNPINNYCGTCTKCIQACPTKAIVEPFVIDSNKCISYLTIEHKSSLPKELKNKFNNFVFGCDICQDVCPWNLKSKKNINKDLVINYILLNLSNEEWNNLTLEKFKEVFKLSSINYIKFENLIRNIDFIKD